MAQYVMLAPFGCLHSRPIILAGATLCYLVYSGLQLMTDCTARLQTVQTL